MNRLGAGPASISAGIYAVSCRKRALILEKGQVATAVSDGAIAAINAAL